MTSTYWITNTSPASTDPVTIDSVSDSRPGSTAFSLLTSAAAASTTITLSLHDALPISGYVLGNTVTVVGHDDEGDSTSASASATVTYTDVTPSLSVVKTISRAHV